MMLGYGLGFIVGVAFAVWAVAMDCKDGTLTTPLGAYECKETRDD